MHTGDTHAPSAGQKVTNDPQAKIPHPESIGVVTSDSLAAESLHSHGSFAAGNPHAAAMNQPSKSTTTNNQDTSSARKLDAAPDADAREANKNWSDQANQINSGRGLRSDSGAGSGVKFQHSSDSGVSKSSGPGTAPTGSYAGSDRSAIPSGNFKPHGKSLKTEGFEGNEPNASFNQAIGTDDDPGRMAENRLAGGNAQTASAAGNKDFAMNMGKGGQYDALKVEEGA